MLQTNGSGVLSFAGVSASAGQVIQVLGATDTTQRSTTSSSFVTGSNTLSVTITPSSASNKIYIIYTATANCSDQIRTTIYRGSTNLGNATYGLAWSEASTYPHSGSYLDSPATTSATTYQVYFNTANSASGSINTNGVRCSITAFEIKG